VKTILITGGNGFMGKSLQEIFRNDSSYKCYFESRRTGLDLIEYESTMKKLDSIKPDIIIHAAAHVGSIVYVTKNTAEVAYDNTAMYLNLYKCVSRFNKNIIIINPISNCSYPGIINIQNEENWWDGIIHESVESYGNSKKMGFILSECYRKQYEIKTINLIMANAYGPNDYVDEQRTHAMNGIIMRMIKAKKNMENSFSVWGSGKPIREWIYMPDMARLIKFIVDTKKFSLPNPINIGQESGISIIDSVYRIREILNYNVEIVQDTTKQDGAPIKVLGSKLFKMQFPDFKFTGYDVGIKNTIDYYQVQLADDLKEVVL
jgi:GDP-L-fucose synthase